MFINEYDPDYHALRPSSEAFRWVHREFPSFRDLFVYENLRTGNWMIAEWLNRDRGWFVELCNLGPQGIPPTGRDRDDLRKKLLDPVRPSDIRRLLRNKEYVRRKRLRESRLRLKELERKLLRDNHPGDGGRTQALGETLVRVGGSGGG